MRSVEKTIRREMKNERFARAYSEERMRLEIAHRMAEARHKHHLSQTTVAHRMGVTPQAVSRMEKGLLNLTLGSIYKYAKAVREPLVITIG